MTQDEAGERAAALRTHWRAVLNHDECWPTSLRNSCL